jgi:hypothetical protein
MALEAQVALLTRRNADLTGQLVDAAAARQRAVWLCARYFSSRSNVEFLFG